MRYYLITEAAEVARTSPNTVRYWLQTGKLRGHRPGRRVLIRSDVLERFLSGPLAAEPEPVRPSRRRSAA